MLEDDMHPYVKLSWCKLDKLGVLNRCVSSLLRGRDTTEKDRKYLRLNMFLCFELVNETLMYDVGELVKGSDLREVVENMTAVIGEQQQNIGEVKDRLGDIGVEKDRKHLLLKVTKELMRFFEILRDINVKYPEVFCDREFRFMLLKVSNVLREELPKVKRDTQRELVTIVDTLERSFDEFLKIV